MKTELFTIRQGQEMHNWLALVSSKYLLRCTIFLLVIHEEVMYGLKVSLVVKKSCQKSLLGKLFMLAIPQRAHSID